MADLNGDYISGLTRTQARIAIDVLGLFQYTIEKVASSMNHPTITPLQPPTARRAEQPGSVASFKPSSETIVGIGAASIIGGVLTGPLIAVALALTAGFGAAVVSHGFTREPKGMSNSHTEAPSPSRPFEDSFFDYDLAFGFLEELFKTVDTIVEEQREITDIPIVATASFSRNVSSPQPNDVILGNLLEGGKETSVPYPISLQTLVKHTLVTGITGSGKSNTCLRLLGELQKQDVPFLVIEPAKDEYVEWAMRINASLPPEKRIRIYMPGVAAWRGQPLTHQLRLNPLDVVWLSERHTPSVLSHVDRLKSILNASFPMQEALPMLLEDVLFAVYSKPFNWWEEVLPPFDTPRPTLRQMFDVVREVIRQKGYDERVTANLAAALMTRIQSLRRGWKGQLFDQPRSTPWADIFDRPVVINLSQLGDDTDRAFAMAVLLQFLYEYRQAQFNTDTFRRDDTKHLRHLTMVEEAHRILQSAAPSLPAQANPQGKVAEMFSDVLSEICAYGEGLLIVDQAPVRLVPDAIKNGSKSGIPLLYSSS